MTADARQRLRVIAAFAVVYIVWGSTYLGIRIGVQEIPPAMLAGIRNVIAGVFLASVARVRGQTFPPTTREWMAAAVVGILLIVGGNGLVTWAEQWVPSNQTALIVTTSALWIAWFGTFGPKGQPLTPRIRIGLVIGFIGAVLMLLPGRNFSIEHLGAQLGILLSTLCWAAGAMYSRSLTLQTRPLMFAAIQMLIGGVLLTGGAVISGAPAEWKWSLSGIGALLYLTVFGSCIAYTTYIWLLNHTTPDKLSTISYVNPVVALLLGWAVLGETLSGARFAGMFVILAGVILVTARPFRRVGRPQPADGTR